MKTSYHVKCPQPNCGYSGNLLPIDNMDSWCGAVPAVTVANFQCPRCRVEWKAKVKGDDVENLPIEQTTTPFV